MNQPLNTSARPRICFYQSRDFVPASMRYVPRNYDPSRLHYAAKFAEPMRTVMEYFDETAFERAGTLMGEYVPANVGVLIRRDGMLIKMNVAAEEPWASRKMDELCATPELQGKIKALQKIWDRLPVVENEPLLSHPYHDNYFHWSLEVIPNLRFFEDAGGVSVCGPCLHRLFQRDLLGFCTGGRPVHPLAGPVVIRNPGLCATTMTEEAVWWLRRRVGIAVKPGRRRIYLRRSGTSQRWPRGGGVSEDAAFRDFLDRNGFETVEFGSGELRIEEQVRLLGDAAVILAPHGAALANLAYLSAPLKVIEIMGAHTPRAMFMHLSSICGFVHHVVFSASYDENGDIDVDVEDLREALAASEPPRLS